MTLERLYGEFLQSEGICTDTRQQLKGTIFFALTGERFDGNHFVKEALRKGCRLAVSGDAAHEGIPGVLVTGSPLEMLQQLAAYHRQQVAPVVLAITGSNGKTTTKELVAAILARKFSVLATAGNLNNHIGVPLTLLSLRREEVAVIEMGANHSGEIRFLAGLAAPDLGLITNVGKAHLEGFGSLTGVLDAKGELYEYLAGKGRKAIVDGEEKLLAEKAAETGVEVLVVGEKGQLPVTAKVLAQAPFLEIELAMGDAVRRVSTGLVGTYNLQNIRMAAAIGYHLGVDPAAIADAIGSYVPGNHRSQLLEGERNRVVMDSYNANPSSMREAIKGFLEYAGSPGMLILGDMAELGDSSREEHVALVRWIATLPLDRVLLAGPLFHAACTDCKTTGNMVLYRDTGELAEGLRSDPPSGFHILVKGSRVMGLERLTPLLSL